ncbi:tRNA (adenosine(37)-N6)-threonylcarbamoyltransferase complex dimerization subunit type 1 TsaB [Mycobacterium hackensackense]|uniref:tRNA (adenosine(37)-N6)-threonylcarbamoyltransferase complex dimerization subunit type 1 TsaB n=1 Tax=Mycobacterium hackensackense TaxID=228909 RepID=UPI0022658B8B|nr:tRNA (adenosine(37)-N6)-threonylcarbamoyltransferase complex dimerization subunit type 1 TsaB [Mycobacterium hackensackense]MCV7252292.1 tRNA (adenosine(37)-N6)-threonylcarbamoyltransferase complex dimerization subunit type 1 TsaB [Mycobacterium hackensackense]
MRIVLIDTAGVPLFVGLVVEGKLVESIRIESGHAVATLHSMLLDLLTRCGLELRDIDQFAVVSGPGNWTGVNVAVVAAKMLALSLGTPLLILSRMQALIDCAAKEWETGTALIGCGRVNVFCAFFGGEHGPRQTAGSVSLRKSLDEVRTYLMSGGGAHIVVLKSDAMICSDLDLTGANEACFVSYDALVSAYLDQIGAGAAKLLMGAEIHLALPDYAGADQTINTSPGSFR